MPKPLTKAETHELFRRLAAERPDPKSELQFINPYTLLVAVVLSAQATDKSVNLATGPLFRSVRTPEAMLALGEAKLAAAIRTIGLYRTKAKNVIALSRRLIEEFGGQVPQDRENLESLPGVGRKTANVVLNVAFGAPTIAVDTHVFRVANRTGLASAKDPIAVGERLEKVVPQEFLHGAHHWLILHGRYVCTARAPKCPECVIRDLCRFKEKTKALSSVPSRGRLGSGRKDSSPASRRRRPVSSAVLRDR
ncbi:MAG: endonuclease III [Alphaproteobacteria bacterium]